MTRSTRRLGFLIAVLALAAGPAGRAGAGIITTQQVHFDQQFVGVVETLRFSFGAAADGQPFRVTEPVNLTVDDIGSLHPLAAPGSLLALLTDGADDTTQALYEGVGSSTPPVPVQGPESSFFTDPAIPGPDLHGFDLARISLRVDALAFEVVRSGDRDLTNLTFTGTLIFEDSAANPVPAPPSAVLAGLAGVMLLARTIRRRRTA
jgi:hypothetical protein